MPDKKYLIEIPGMPEGSGVWDSDKWERNKDAFMSDYPEANVFELGEYDAEDTNENDQIMLTFENDPDSSGVWDSAKWERNKEAFTADHPEAKVNRVRYVDYWGNAAQENRVKREELSQPDAERDARLADLGYYDDMSGQQKDFSLENNTIGLKPVSSAIEQNSVSGETTYHDPKLAEFYANDSAHTERMAEIARLDAEYDSNPSVVAQREWEQKERAEQEKYIDDSLASIRADINTEVNALEAGKGAFYKTASSQGMGDAAIIQQAMEFMRGKDAGQAYVENEKLETYASAAKLFEKAKQAYDVAGKGFWGATADVGMDKLRDLATQSDIEAYNQIGDILTRLETRLGSLDEVTDKDIESNLSKEEQALIKGFFAYNEAMSNAQQDMSQAYKGGKIFGESISFMLEFLATGGLAGGTGKAAGNAVGKGLVKWAAKAAKGTAQRAARTVATKAARALTSAAVGTLARTVAAPGTYQRMAEDSVKIEDGHLNRGKNAFEAFADSYIENLSEISGGVIGKSLKMAGVNPSKILGGMSFGKVGKMLADNSVMQAIAKGGKALFGENGVLKKFGFNGIFEEVEEEYIGNLIRELTIQPGALEEMHKDGNFGAMLIGFAPMTLFGAGMSAASIGAKNIEAANLGKKLRENLSLHYTDQQIDHMMNLVSGAENADQVWEAIKPLTVGLSAEETQQLYQYGAFMAQNKAMLFAKKAQDDNLAQAKRAEAEHTYGKFWQENAEGAESVQLATLNDGRSVFVLSEPTADGVVSIIDAKTGEKGFTNVSNYKTQEVNGEVSPMTQKWSMDAYLEGSIAADRMTAEQARMTREYDEQVKNLQSQIQEGTQINLGTEGSPVILLATGKFVKDGVVAVDQTGNTHTVGWNQVADAMGQPIIVKTDQQIVDEEIAGIVARNAERRKKMSNATPAMTEAVNESAAQTSETVAQETKHIPLNEDGTVNEAAFWEQDPEGYAQWNDEQNQDGGADTIQQIEAAKAELTAMLNEAQRATLTSNPANRKAAKREVGRLAERLARLEALEQSYADRSLAPLRERAKMWADLTGASVHVLETEEELAAISSTVASENEKQGSRVRGFAKDGRAYIFLPGIKDIKEIDEVFFHEAVAHNGLKGLLGKENYDKLCEQVWNMMSQAARNQFIRYPGVNGDYLAAADEYIAHIAEKMGAGIAEAEEKTIWQKIVDFVRNVLREMGIELNVTERELSDLLHQAYADLANNMAKAEQIATGEAMSAVEEASSEARQQYDALLEDLTPEEIEAVAQNDFNAAQEAYNAHLANAPKVEPGESSKAYIERKKAYNDELKRLEAELNAQQALMDEITAIKAANAPVLTDVEILEQDGFGVDTQNDDVRMSVRYTPTDEQKEAIINSIVNVTGRSREEAERWLASETSLAAMINDDLQYLDYVADPKYKAIKDNSDYPQGTVDFNNICRKRVPFTRMFTRLQRTFPNRVFTADELADIRTIMSKDGLTVACGLCYVEDRRQMVGEVAQSFIDGIQEGFETYANNPTKRKNAEKFKALIGEDAYVPQVYDLTTQEGLDKLYNEHRGIWEAFQAFNNARGQQSQNLLQGYAEYKREILSWSDKKVKQVNDNGGLRIFSYSDFEAHHLIDVVQIIIDCASKGVKIQGYTKVPAFARAVANTGIKLNRSLIPLGDTGLVDGQLAFDPVEGIDINDPDFLESNDNVGNILIGINDEQIRVAMNDPRIHYIIPYHARQKENIRQKLNVGAWTNYISTQNERNVSDGKRVKDNINIYTDILTEDITTDRQFVEKYLQLCAEQGRIPKFDQFLDKDAEGNYVYTPGYYKFLIDFKLFDENGNILPQQPVVAEFDDAFNMQILENYAKDERESTGEQMNETYDKIVDALGLDESTAEGEDIRFSARTDEQREALFDKAKAQFGLTNNFKVAGYMLPDGSLLDFSEANNGGNPNQRSLDHREIEGIIMDEGKEYDSRWMYLADFMNEGAIRLLPEYAGINLMKAPTKEQRQKLFDFIYKYNGEVILEIADERLNNVAYVEYDRRTSPSRIFRDIDGYFNEGIVPQQDVRLSIANENQAIFVSNAARAVEGIKMEKATPEQWLKMIEKNGGLKTGEDKWMGLSDWLKSSDKKTLTKQEVLDFINENMIQIEEVHYAEGAEDDAENTYAMIERILQEKFGKYIAEYYEQNNGEDGLYGGDSYEYAMDKLREEMNDEFPYTIERSNSVVYLTFPYEETDDLQEWADKLGVKFAPQNPIDYTRLGYTTDGLSNKHEIALTVPTIESWNESDEIHFGDAGEGRAVAWVRFGETKIYANTKEGEEYKAFVENMLRRYHIDEDVKLSRFGNIVVPQELLDALTDEQFYELQMLKAASMEASDKTEKTVLVIDEIQSKRHQEGREKGYRSSIEDVVKATEAFQSFNRAMKEKYGENVFPSKWSEEDQAEFDRLRDEHSKVSKSYNKGVPDAPFEKNWHELAMKRMLRYAAENGYDAVAWTKGDQQAERYDIGGVVDSVYYAGSFKEGVKDIDINLDTRRGGNIHLQVDNNGEVINEYNDFGDVKDSQYIGKNLSEILGKELANKVLSLEEGQSLSGEGLRVGGEGMKGFYDKMLPAFMDKYGKKWGIKVEDIELPNLESGLTMHSVPVTEGMKASVMEGQVMFSVRTVNQTAQEFHNDALTDFRRQFNLIQPTTVVDVNDRAALAEALGLTPEELSDEKYQLILDGVNDGGRSFYDDDTKRIAIFALEEQRTSAEVSENIFHENTHAIISKNPELLELGQWLWDNAKPGAREKIKSAILEAGYPEWQDANEMLSRYTGAILAIGRAGEVLNMLPAEQKKHWEFILKEFGYEPEREDGERKRRYDADSRRAGFFRKMSQQKMSDNGAAEKGTRFSSVGITPEVRDEMDRIAATAIIDGNYMLAPNGQPTKLTADQWAMVRTKNFINWFGDWINDPENASKVVDENGEPMVVYHGTGADFTKFVASESDRGHYYWKLAHFGTREQAEDVMRTTPGNKHIMELFLNIRNPYRISDQGGGDEWGYAAKQAANGMFADQNGENADGLVYLNEYEGKIPADSYAVWNPSQIKSATDNTGEFSESDDIRFSTRFDVNTNPTEAQKKAGNYKMGHLRLDGYNITIENPKGSVRRGTDSKGNEWKNTLNNDYGYIRGTKGVDGDHIDVYLSDNPAEGNVFVVDQVNPETREFDEHKVMYGFNSMDEARNAYLANFSEGWNGLGTITEVTKDEFRKWIDSSHRKTKPFSEYKSVKTDILDEDDIRYSLVTDPALLERLQSEPTIKVYRAMQLVDGKLYPPMSAKVDGKMREPIELGKWEQAEERPDLADEKGYFKLDKGNKTSLKARYNPYFHTSPTPLNDQFSSAQTRPELVTVEVEVPESELTSGYKAEKAKDPVGQMEWKAGVVQGKLSGTRTVILSRWDKPVRIVPDSEVADVIVKMFEGKDITMPSNVVTPSLRTELEKRGVPFVETDNSGKPTKEDVRFSVVTTPTDKVVAEGMQLSLQDFAQLAGNIFQDMPESFRKEAIEETFRNGMDMQSAIFQIPARLAEKTEWTDEDKNLARIIREKVQDAVDESGAVSDRPLTTKEALWMLYRSTAANGSDLISAARRSLVAHNLGFDPRSERIREMADDHIRYSVVRNNMIDSATDMYNYEASLWTSRLKESWLDMNQSVISLQNALAEASGKPIESWEDVVLALNQLSSKSYADKKIYMRDFLEPLWDVVLKITKATDYRIEDIERYMMLKHALERNLAFAKRDAREYYETAFRQSIAAIEGNESLSDADKQKQIDKAQKTLDKHFTDIDAGTDAKFLEFREKDYGGLTSMFTDFDRNAVGKRSSYKSEESYQQAVIAATRPRYDNVADMEDAAKYEVDVTENELAGLAAELWDKINAATKEVLRHQHASGMITTEQYNAVRNMFQHYVPLRGFADNTAEDMYSYYMNNSSNGFAMPIIGAKGRKTKAESPLGWIGTMAESAIQADNKNDAKIRLYYALLNRPDTGVLSIAETWYEYTGQNDANGRKIFAPVYPPATGKAMTADELRQHMDTWESSMMQKQAAGNAFKGNQSVNLRGSVVFQDTKEDKEHIIRVKVAGKDYSILVNGNPRAAQAINGLLNPDANVGPVGEWIGSLRRNMSALMTSFSPLFWVSNYQRDLLSSFMRTSESEGWKQAFKYLNNRRRAWRVASYIYKNDKGKLGNSYYENLYKEFAENGGITGYTSLTTNKEYEKLLEDYAQFADKPIRKWIKNAWNNFMGFGEAIEQVSRFAAFITAREAGKSIEEAVNAAKEVSVNFNRKGSAKPLSLDEIDKLKTKDGKPLNMAQKAVAIVLTAMPKGMKELYFFFNASIQALSSSAKLAKQSPGKATAWAGMYMGLSMALAAINYLISGDDDEEEYLDLPDYVRRSNALVKISDEYYLKWSLPQEMRPFYATADIILGKAAGNMPHKNVGKEVALAMAEWLPVNPFGTDDPLLSLVPDFAAPLAEIKANKNFVGGKIYDDMAFKSEGEKVNIPAFRKATSKTGKVYVDVAEVLNAISGGDEVQKGAININPAVVEHLVEGYGGGLYDFAKMMVSFPAMLLSDEDLEVRDIPFVNKVIMSVDETNMYTHTNEVFYHYRDIAENAERVEKEYRNSDDPSRADAYRQEEDWRIHLLFEQYDAELKESKDKLKNAADKEEEDLLKQSQNAVRELLLNDIATGKEPDPVLALNDAIKEISKEISAIKKPFNDAEKKRKKAKESGDMEGAQKAKKERDEIRKSDAYKTADKAGKDLKELRDLLDEIKSTSLPEDRDSLIAKFNDDYQALKKKLESK